MSHLLFLSVFDLLQLVFFRRTVLKICISISKIAMTDSVRRAKIQIAISLLSTCGSPRAQYDPHLRQHVYLL